MTGILKHCEKQHYTELLKKNKGNIKDTWKIVNSLIDKNEGNTIPYRILKQWCRNNWQKKLQIIEKNVFPFLAYNIPRSSNVFTRYLSVKVDDSLFLKPATEKEIINLVKNIKRKKSKNPDDIDMYLVKKILHHLVTPLEHIFNTSLQKGVLPDSMKMAQVIPVFKNG